MQVRCLFQTKPAHLHEQAARFFLETEQIRGNLNSYFH